jgi:hypothetical protein
MLFVNQNIDTTTVKIGDRTLDMNDLLAGGRDAYFTLATFEEKFGAEAASDARRFIEADRIPVIYTGNGSRFKFWLSSFIRAIQEDTALLSEHRERLRAHRLAEGHETPKPPRSKERN